jgi:hypothetical protein
VVIVGGIGFQYLQSLPSGTVSHALEFAGVGAGVVFASFFVLMVLTMITIRTISVIARARRQGADLGLSDSRIAAASSMPNRG